MQSLPVNLPCRIIPADKLFIRLFRDNTSVSISVGKTIMSNISETTSKQDQSKIRSCLRCKKSFPSEWIGERICNRCKKSKAWKDSVNSSNYHKSTRR